MMSDRFKINGYRIRYNDFWGYWQVSHPSIGFVAEFAKKEDAIEHCEKG